MLLYSASTEDVIVLQHFLSCGKTVIFKLLFNNKISVYHMVFQKNFIVPLSTPQEFFKYAFLVYVCVCV